MNITRENGRKRYRVHAHVDGRPVCGGGNGARSAGAWQTDLGGVNCERCLAIMEARARKAMVIDFQI